MDGEEEAVAEEVGGDSANGMVARANADAAAEGEVDGVVAVGEGESVGGVGGGFTSAHDNDGAVADVFSLLHRADGGDVEVNLAGTFVETSGDDDCVEGVLFVAVGYEPLFCGAGNFCYLSIESDVAQKVEFLRELVEVVPVFVVSEEVFVVFPGGAVVFSEGGELGSVFGGGGDEARVGIAPCAPDIVAFFECLDFPIGESA